MSSIRNKLVLFVSLLLVLAVAAVEVASHGGQGQAGRARVKMEQGLLLHGINMLGNRFSVDERIQDPAAILPDSADSSLALVDGAAESAQTTRDSTLILFCIEQRFPHGRLLSNMSKLYQ